MTFDLDLIPQIASLRDAERMYRREGSFDRADTVRQLADAYENHGRDLLRCEFPRTEFRKAGIWSPILGKP